MQTNFTGKNIEITPALKAHAEEKINILLAHEYPIINMQMTFSVEHATHIAEANLSIKGHEFHAKSEEDDMYKAIDLTVKKLDQQLHKHKEKLIASHR